MDSRLKTLQEEVATAIAGFSAEHLNWHPAGKWSAAEVLEHLYLTYTGTIKGFEKLMQAGKISVSKPNWRQRAGHLLVLRFSYMPPGRESPAVARPKGVATEKVLAEIEQKILEMDETIGRAEEKMGSGKLLDHVILGPLTGAEWRKFHLVHGRHHLQQIRRLREAAKGSSSAR